MRIVIDPNVLISAAVATGVSAELVDRWLSERPFEIVACPTLLAELREVLQRDKFRRGLDHTSVTLYVDRIERESESWLDPGDISPVTGDPKDDYLVALFLDSAADLIVSGDPDLTSLAIDDVTVPTRVSCSSNSDGPRAWVHAVQHPHQRPLSADYAGMGGDAGAVAATRVGPRSIVPVVGGR